MEHYDVIIIGTGAGGGTLAHRLAPSGKRILLLERGGYLPREPENWDSDEVFNKDRYLSGEQWFDKDGQPFRPHQQYFVGGNTKFYGAILFRLRERDFGEVRHYGGVSPAWPLSYADLEPYYTEAERLYLVHGERGEDPTEPSASAPYPVPGGLARAAHPAAARRLRGAPATSRSTCRSASTSTSPIPRRARCVRCDTLRRLPVPDRRQGRRARAAACGPALQHRERDAAHAREGRAARDRRDAAAGHRGRRRPPRRARSATAPTSWSSSCGAVNSAALLLRSASDATRRAGELARTRSGATTWPTSTRA